MQSQLHIQKSKFLRLLEANQKFNKEIQNNITKFNKSVEAREKIDIKMYLNVKL